jgi:hypothetical protein
MLPFTCAINIRSLFKRKETPLAASLRQRRCYCSRSFDVKAATKTLPPAFILILFLVLVFIAIRPAAAIAATTPTWIITLGFTGGCPPLGRTSGVLSRSLLLALPGLLSLAVGLFGSGLIPLLFASRSRRLLALCLALLFTSRLFARLTLSFSCRLLLCVALAISHRLLRSFALTVSCRLLGGIALTLRGGLLGRSPLAFDCRPIVTVPPTLSILTATAVASSWPRVLTGPLSGALRVASAVLSLALLNLLGFPLCSASSILRRIPCCVASAVLCSLTLGCSPLRLFRSTVDLRPARFHSLPFGGTARGITSSPSGIAPCSIVGPRCPIRVRATRSPRLPNPAAQIATLTASSRARLCSVAGSSSGVSRRTVTAPRLIGS